jgi:hypothetical protein
MDDTSPRVTRRALPAVVLFALSPLVAEYLLGNVSIDHIGVALVLAPFYGGGAILVREAARRRAGGFAAILLLGFAYAVVEEGLVVQTLFNPSYFGLDLLRDAHLAWAGIGMWWSLFVLTLHTVWSIAVPIALTEALFPERANGPWLGRVGLGVTAALFAAGAWASGSFTYQQEKFLASPAQLAGAALVAAASIAAALRLPAPPSGRAGPVPRPLTVGLLALLASSAFMVARRFVGGWAVVCVYAALFACVIAAVRAWSAREAWGRAHVLALAGGALLTYAWHSFVQEPVVGGRGTVDLVGNAVFSAGAVLVLVAAARRLRRPRGPQPASSAVGP